jgi:hypothetical protein
MNADGYFTNKNGFIYLDADYAEVYIPKYYFDNNKFAEDFGTKVSTIGLLVVGFGKNGTITEKKILNLPTLIELFITDYEDRNVEIKEGEFEKCKVLIYNKGNKIMNDNLTENSENVGTFLDLVLAGKIPDIIPYDKSIDIWLKNQSMNNVNFGVSPLIEELILSVAYRYKNDISKKFAEVIGKDPNVSLFDYKMSSIREICQYTSTFAGLTFEDFNGMATTALNRSANHEVETPSPLEVLFKL